MMLTLTIKNPESLEAGKSAELVVNQRDATIGRSSGCDWSLPDPDKVISSKHCTVKHSDGAYRLLDVSTNGTFLNGGVERMAGEHRIANGDVFLVGRFQIQAALSEDTKVDAAAAPPAEAVPPPPPPPPPPVPSRKPEPALAAAAEDEDAASKTVFMASDQLWDQMTSADTVDWERGGFTGGGERAEATVWQPSVSDGEEGGAGLATAADQDLQRLVTAFLEEAGLGDKDVPDKSPDIILRAARLMKRMVSGLVVMVEARARAKSQMGAEATALSFEGNNPIKFARTPEQALARLLNPAERGFMEGEPAIEDAFVDLQAHQVATLKAMQGALRTALNRFSPDAIRRRAELKGFFSRILPGARDAALWQNYEREFGLVAQESDEAFLEVFAKQFRKAYEQQTLKAKEGKGG